MEDFIRVDVREYVETGIKNGDLVPFWAIKYGRVMARRGEVGEVVFTYTDGGIVEKENKVKIDPKTGNPGWILTKCDLTGEEVIAENGAVEEYTINAVLAKEVKAQKVTCEKSDCSHGLVMLVSILGTLLVCIGAFFGFAKAGYIKVKTSSTKTKLERTLVKKDEDTSKKD